MKKPERLLYGHDPNDKYVNGFNQCWDEMEAYYQQEIKENYIRKDELEKIIEKMQNRGEFYVGDKLSQSELIENSQLAGYRYALADVLKSIKGEK